jgi:hypothetical protein
MEAIDKANTELQVRLDEGKSVLFVPQGISMLPFIRGGRDKVLVRKAEAVGVGDIVLAPHGGHLILHRVYAFKGTQLVLMGDGNLEGNEVVGKSEVWGKVLEIIKPNGRSRKPHKAWFWRHTLFIRRPILKMRRKWYKLRGLNPE